MSDELKITITTKTTDIGSIEQVTDWMGSVTQTVVDMQDKQIQDELVKAGWMPPNTRTDERAEIQAAIRELRDRLRSACNTIHGLHCANGETVEYSEGRCSKYIETLENTKKWSEHDQ